MPKTKDGGYRLHEPEAAAGPYAPPEKEQKKTRKKPPTVKRTGNKRSGKKR